MKTSRAVITLGPSETAFFTRVGMLMREIRLSSYEGRSKSSRPMNYDYNYDYERDGGGVLGR